MPIAPLGTPFTSTTGVLSGTSASWVDVLTTGVVITQNVTGLTPQTAYHWRVRLLYRPGNRLGQAASRWVHVPWNGWQETDFRTPASAEAPVTGFTAAPTSGTVPLTVTFTNTTTGQVTSYEWSYGDSITSTTSAVTHTHAYTAAGVYTVSLTATGPGGPDTLTRTNYITVSASGGSYTTTTTVITYAYDALNRLTEADYSDGTSYEYEYDKVGNRKAMTTTETITYEYDAANRLTTVGGVSYTYDDNGNLTNDGTYTYTWSVAGRLTQAESVTHTIVYTYNGDGVRVAQEVDGQTTTWVQDTIGLAQVLLEASGGAETLYLYGYLRLAQIEGGSAEWFLGDALGSVRQLTDDNGDVILARDYSPYGQQLAEDGTGSSGYGFTGEQLTGYTQFVYLRARWLDPESGRFVSPDTWTGSIYQPLSLHKYLYVFANPLSYTDPSGLNGEPIPIEQVLGQLFEQARDSDGNVNGVEALALMFESNGLPGRTIEERLDWILSYNAAGGITYFPIGKLPMLYPGEPNLTGRGLTPRYLDDDLYVEWYGSRKTSNQVGHFLAAVAWGRYAAVDWGTYEAVKEKRREVIAVTFVAGHEMTGDGFFGVSGIFSQLAVGLFSPRRREAFLAAADSSIWSVRERKLQECGAPAWFNYFQPMGGSFFRRGNSMADLRLSAEGWNLGKAIGEGRILADRAYVADYIRYVLGEEEGF